ncbi:MAG: methionine--tRNA ligase [Clostridia bacterium]|nr:methionine--tRNA ligase [Clostridia bacterium]
MNKEKFYITTAIAYTSGKPHIGNTYEIVLSDFIARFKRMQGYDVHFQTGTDEHGEKIELKAKDKGVTPKAFVDDVAGTIKTIWDLMDTSYDHFIRTTDTYHEKQVQKLFKKFYEQGDIYKGSYKGWYCTPCESFWTESQLVDGKCPDCGREVKLAEEEAYFFKMSKYADALIKYYEEHPDFITPVSRRNEMMNNFLKPGLHDLCVSRTSFKWGIPVEFDPGHVVYVWLDALTNYITGIGYDAEGNHSEEYKKWWPADVHVIGKDIVRFHTIYWPIFLMAMGEPLPKKVFGHPWLLQDGDKMSKSRGNVMYADDMVKFYGVDPLRYFLLSQMPFDNDGVISWDIVTDSVNSDLANIYGNLVSRTVAMSQKYFDGVLENAGVEEDVDKELKEVVTSAYKKVADKVDQYRIADAMQEIMQVFRRANKYIDETMPWALAKDESKKDRLKTVLYNLAETIVIGTTLMENAMPTLAKEVYAQFGTTARKVEELSSFGLLSNGTKVVPSEKKLFTRLVNKEINEKVEAMYAERKKATEAKVEPKAEVKAPEQTKKDTITIDTFAQVELKVGKVIACEKLVKSNKLLKSTVEIGDETRTILSGIAKYYTPEEMVGKLVVVVTNLAPAKLCGTVSEGMLLCASDANGNVVLLTPEQVVASGSNIS